MLSLLCYGLGVFSEESLLAFLPLFALSVWLATPRLGRREWRRLAYASLPFCAVLAPVPVTASFETGASTETSNSPSRRSTRTLPLAPPVC